MSLSLFWLSRLPYQRTTAHMSQECVKPRLEAFLKFYGHHYDHNDFVMNSASNMPSNFLIPVLIGNLTIEWSQYTRLD